jgi:hypothetical protein
MEWQLAWEQDPTLHHSRSEHADSTFCNFNPDQAYDALCQGSSRLIVAGTGAMFASHALLESM